VSWWTKGFGASHAASLLLPVFVFLFSTYDYPASILMLLVVLASAFLPLRYSFRPMLNWIADHVWLVTGIVFVVLTLCTLGLSAALAQDEIAPYFQSRIFAAGHITGQIPPGLIERLIPPVYEDHFYFVSHNTGRIVSGYWPGFALLLTPFTFLGIPYACNPMLSALTLPVMHRLALRIFAVREAAGLAVLFTVASPVFFADGISYYSMSAHLLANCVYALLLLDPTPRRALAAGAVGSVALVLHNPVPHMLFAVPWILLIARRQDAARIMGWLLTGYLPLCLVLGLGWAKLASGMPNDGITAVAASSAGAAEGLGRFISVFSLPDRSIWLARWVGIVKVWIWAVPGLMLLALVGAWKWRHDPYCRAFAVSALVTLVGYLLVPADQGHGWGYRYFHSAWMVLPLLAAGALVRLPSGLQPNPDATWIGRLTEDTSMRDYIVACALLTLALGCGLRAVQIREFLANQGPATLPSYTGTERRVVLLNRGVDLTQVDPWLRGTVLYLQSRGPEADAAMMRSYFPQMRQVFADSAGTVWSAATPVAGRND
jgi:hypothetical protein